MHPARLPVTRPAEFQFQLMLTALYELDVEHKLCCLFDDFLAAGRPRGRSNALLGGGGGSRNATGLPSSPSDLAFFRVRFPFSVGLVCFLFPKDKLAMAVVVSAVGQVHNIAALRLSSAFATVRSYLHRNLRVLPPSLVSILRRTLSTTFALRRKYSWVEVGRGFSGAASGVFLWTAVDFDIVRSLVEHRKISVGGA